MAQLPPLYALDHAAPTSVTEEGKLELEEMQQLADLADEEMLVKMFASLSADDLVRLQNAVADERCVGGRSGCFTTKEFDAVMSLLVELYNKTGTSKVPMGNLVSDPEAPTPAPTPAPAPAPMPAPAPAPPPKKSLKEMVHRVMYLLKQQKQLPQKPPQQRRVVVLLRR